MAIELTICNTRFHDAQLRDATERINRYAGEILRNGFAIGATMAMVENTRCYENDGFKSTVEWAMKSFNLKKSAVYNYLKIGKDFTREIVSNKGKTTGYCHTTRNRPRPLKRISPLHRLNVCYPWGVKWPLKWCVKGS